MICVILMSVFSSSLPATHLIHVVASCKYVTILYHTMEWIEKDLVAGFGQVSCAWAVDFDDFECLGRP